VVTMLTVLTVSDLEILHVCTVRGNVRFRAVVSLPINVRFQRSPHQLFLLYNNTNAALPCST